MIIDYRDRNTTVGSVVAGLPEAAEIFDDLHIDYCCGGNRLLEDILLEQRIDAGAVYEKLDLAQKNRSTAYEGAANDFGSMSAVALSIYVQDKHHAYLRSALPEISELLGTVLRAHGRNHKELFDVYSMFGRLKSDLEQHLIKEEDMLFPAFDDEDANRRAISALASEIIREHEAAGGLLSELRTITNDYMPPEDACGSYQRAYQMLAELENDLHRHIHLENNILLKDYDDRQDADHRTNSCEIIN